MNRALNFKNKTLELEFQTRHNLSPANSYRLINIIMLCIAITYTSRYVSDLLFDPDVKLVPTFAGLSIIYGAILSYYLGRFLFRKFNLGTNTVDLIVMVISLCAMIFMNNPLRLPKQPVNQVFWDTYEIGMYNLIIIHLMRRWYHKALYFVLSCIYFFVMNQNNLYDHLMIIKLTGFSVMVSFLFYFMEKSVRLNFLERHNQEVSTKHILKALPEGILIIDDKFECLHSNPALETMFSDLDVTDKSSVESFTKSIIEPKPRTFVQDFRSQIYERIIMVQDTPRVSRLGNTNTLMSEEASVHLSNRVGTPLRRSSQRNINIRRKSQYINNTVNSYQKENEKKEDYATMRMDSQDANATSLGFTTPPTSLCSYIRAFFEAFEYTDLLGGNYENVLEHYYFDAKHEGKTLEIIISSFNFNGKKCFLLIFRDETDRGRIEKLENSSKYKSHILATVSHELRTPVTSSLHLLNSVLESPEATSSCTETYIRPATKILTMMLNLINDILDYSQLKKEKLKVVFQPVDIRKLISEGLSLIEIQAKKKGIFLNMELDPLIPSSFETDPNRFTQILLNLLSNALKFTSKGGISVSAVMVEDDESRALLKVSVKDTGIGIKQEDLNKLFIEYEKIELGESRLLNTNGCGLGLTIANKLAKCLSKNGFDGIEVSSKVGKGSTFSFTIADKKKRRRSFELSVDKMPKGSKIKLSKASSYKYSRNMNDFLENSVYNIMEIREGEDPISKKLENHHQIVNASNKDYCCTISNIEPVTRDNYQFVGTGSDEEGEMCGCPKIMIVDDDAFNQLTLESMLSSFKYNATSCFNGEEAVREVKLREESKRCGQFCKNFELIFMDCSMPIKNGIEATKEIKEFFKEQGIKPIPIVGLSSYSNDATDHQSFITLTDFYLTKPISKEKLGNLLWKVKTNDVSQEDI